MDDLTQYTNRPLAFFARYSVRLECIAALHSDIGAIAFLATVSVWMAGSLTVISGIVVVAIFRIAAAGKPLHHDFADKARW